MSTATIHYLVRSAYAYTLTEWIDSYSAWKPRIRIVPYESLGGWLGPGVFVFTDLERLSPPLRRRAAAVREAAMRAGCPVQNDPLRSMGRFDLQQVLSNDFRVHRAEGGDASMLSDVRFPVFLRDEDEHGGQSELIRDRTRLERALAKRPGSLVVEFLDTSDANGLFRKYAATRIGDALFARHLFYNRRWKVRQARVFGEELAREELDYVRDFPHREEVAAAFEKARIEFGRIDYAFYEGRLQIWEINTNPHLKTAVLSTNDHGREAHALADAYVDRAFEALLAKVPADAERVWCGSRLRAAAGAMRTGRPRIRR